MNKYQTPNAHLTQIGTTPEITAEAVYSFNQKEKIMKNIYRRSLILFAFLFVLPFMFVSPASAQTSQEVATVRSAQMMEEDTEAETFRKDLKTFLEEMEATVKVYEEVEFVREKLHKKGIKPSESLAEGKKNVDKITGKELRELREAYSKIGGWRDIPKNLKELLKPEMVEQLNARFAASQAAGVDISNIADRCEDGINANISNTDISIAKAVLIAANAAKDIAPPIVNTPLVVAASVAEGAVLALETLKGIKDDCSGDDFEKAITLQITNAETNIVNNDNSNKTAITTAISNSETNIKTAISTTETNIKSSLTTTQNTITTKVDSSQTAITTAIDNSKTAIINNDNTNLATINTNIATAKTDIVNNDNSNKTTIINNDNSNKTAIVNNDNANTKALLDALLRSQIEADLAMEGSAVKVAWYMTPTANGGHLDLVQQIVTQTLNNIRAAGGSIGTAQSFLDAANADKAAGRFKAAYDNYRKAYKAAAN